MMDLEACYNRQLLLVLGLMQKSIGVNCSVVKVISNIIPRFRHFVCTYYGIAKTNYKCKNEELTNDGQGNIFTGVFCRD